MTLTLEADRLRPNRWLVKDAGRFIGGIHQAGADDWRNAHVGGTRFTPVPLGPFKTREDAVAAFKRALS